MESGKEISDLTRINTRAEADGFHVKNKIELKDRYITADNLFAGMLFPDEYDNIDMSGIGLLNVRELTVVGLVDIIPYIQGVIIRQNTRPVFPATQDFKIEDNVFDSDISEFTKKGIVIIKAAGQADVNSLSFQRTGYYKVIVNVERKLSTNKTVDDWDLGNSMDWMNIKKYQYDSSGNTLTLNDRFSVLEMEESFPPFTPITTTHIRKKESEESFPAPNELLKSYQFEFDVFISDPNIDRVKLEFNSTLSSRPELGVSDAQLIVDYNYAVSVNARR